MERTVACRSGTLVVLGVGGHRRSTLCYWRALPLNRSRAADSPCHQLMDCQAPSGPVCRAVRVDAIWCALPSILVGNRNAVLDSHFAFWSGWTERVAGLDLRGARDG